MTTTRENTMTGLTCLHCGSTCTNGLALCDLCRRKAVVDLEFLPTYFANLTRWTPGRAGSRQPYGSRVLWDGTERGTGDRVRDALDEASNALATWARALGDDRPEVLARFIPDDRPLGELDEAQTARLLCDGFAESMTPIATLEWAGEFVRDVAQHEQALRTLTEWAVPGWYAGACRRCAHPTYTVPGLTWVTCSGCGVTTYARDHLTTLLGEARAWVARPRQIADALVALLDGETDVSRLHERIRKWSLRERLEPVDAWGYNPRLGYSRDYDPITVYRYRLGDVLDLVAATTPKREAESSTA